MCSMMMLSCPLQVGWAHLLVEKYYRQDVEMYNKLSEFFNEIGLDEEIARAITWNDSDFKKLVPFAMKVRNRYTIFNAKTLS